MSSSPPKSLEAALQTIANMLRLAATEVADEQLLDYFNVFLAPFAKGVEEDRVKESLRLFFLNLNQSVSNASKPLQVSMGLELGIPKFLSKENAVGPAGGKAGFYGDFVEESHLLASVFLEILHEETKHKPVLQPSLIVKIRPETFSDKECTQLLSLAHKLAAERGLPYFANLSSEEQVYACYTATGCRFSRDWKQDWELDTLRTSSLDTVLINLPRIAYESEGNTGKLYQLLDEQIEMALRALEIKHQTLKQRTRENLLPSLTQKADGDAYARMENSTRLISFVGLNEATESLTGKGLHEDSKALNLAQEIMKYIHVNMQKAQRKPETRPLLAMASGVEAARRLAALDVERYGWGQVRAKGSKEQPFYTDLVAVPPETKLSFDDRLRIEEQLQLQASGGHLAVLQLGDEKQTAEELLSTTKRLVTSSKIGFFVYSHNMTFCSRCGKTSLGRHSKCPVCSATGGLTYFRRESSKYTVV
jgi:ribonucleoside-triphosphate reductase